MKSANPAQPMLRLSHIMTYSMPLISIAWLMAPIGVVQGIYAKYYNLSLTTIATIILVARVVDAISDPIIGFFADKYREHNNTRKPFILIGGVLFIFSSYFLYSPPPNVSVWYFAGWFIFFYVAWTLFEIPHIAWAAEITKVANEKTKIYSFRSMASYLGALLFYAVPLLPFFDTSHITPDTLFVSVIAANILLLPLLYLCVKTVPDGLPSISASSIVKEKTNLGKLNYPLTQKWHDLRLLLLSIIDNKPFLVFAGAYVFSGIAFGMWYGLIFIYVDAYLDLGEVFAQIFLLAFIVGVIAAPGCYKLTLYLGKKITWMLATILVIASFIYTGLLKPGETNFSDLVILKVMQTLGFTCMNVIAPAMLSEIVDYSTLKSRQERTSTYFSLYTFFLKTSSAIATALGLMIAGWYGFDVAATNHSVHSIQGLTLAIAWLPPVFACVALVFIVLTPINHRRHAIIRRRLDNQAARIEATIEAQGETNYKSSLFVDIKEMPRAKV